MYNTPRIPLNQLIIQGSSRLRECLAHSTDDRLEEMARSNEIFRCCIHSWAHLEDCTLWNTYGEVITIPSCTNEAGLNEEGWRFLQRRFMQQVGHLPPINIMKARISEIRRRQDGSFELIVDNPTADINHCILYRKWHPAADTFLVNTYENLIYWPGKKRKDFLDASDWQCVQKWFKKKFSCCPTQSQLQARMHIVINNR
ncbi:hypothetical protein M5K25_028101 [Dendrobium thyrsiflorum]|uniref:Uncharacterized protein n=1 Tax=Dendrobium thyrsiflorum TaxID=117978 RepID=A0ABD0TVL9_DENTH